MPNAEPEPEESPTNVVKIFREQKGDDSSVAASGKFPQRPADSCRPAQHASFTGNIGAAQEELPGSERSAAAGVEEDGQPLTVSIYHGIRWQSRI